MSTGRDPPASPTSTRRAATVRVASSSSSPQSGGNSAPYSPRSRRAEPPSQVTRSPGQSLPISPLAPPRSLAGIQQPPFSPLSASRRRRSSSDTQSMSDHAPRSPSWSSKVMNDSIARARARDARKVNDSMVYLEGPQVYTCAQCRTHFTSHDDVISKSFHGRHGRAYLFDQCVNVTIGPAEDRPLITGLHTVCDIFCKRCKNLVGWTYKKAYDASQKYKEGKFIIEKINLHLETSDSFDVAPPAGERADRWRKRSMSWGSECSGSNRSVASAAADIIYEYHPSSSPPSMSRSSTAMSDDP